MPAACEFACTLARAGLPARNARSTNGATARAMHEAARVALPPRSWLHHGPKIRPQTDAIVRQLVHELEQRGAPAHALRALQQRWQASLAAR